MMDAIWLAILKAHLHFVQGELKRGKTLQKANWDLCPSCETRKQV
jgi:hypothetical protein